MNKHHKLSRLSHWRTVSFCLLLCLGICRQAHAVYIVPAGTTNWSTLTGSLASITDTDIRIYGKLVINMNATFLNCTNIKMYPGASIDVNDGIIFTIDQSHIYSDGDHMWSGITMLGTPTTGGKIVTRNNTIIEDAMVAINGQNIGGTSSDYSFDILRTTFNRNVISIKKSSTSGYSSTGTHMAGIFKITCVDDVTSASPTPRNLKSGAGWNRPQFGMWFGHVKDLFIGFMHPGPYGGQFEYLNCGIFEHHCQASHGRNSFTNIRDYDPGNTPLARERGTGICTYFNHGSSAPFLPSCSAVATTITFGDIGIYAEEPNDLWVSGATINYCKRGIVYALDDNGKARINNCTIDYCDEGIYSLQNNGSSLEIADNTIAINFPPTYPLSFVIPTAIRIEPTTPAASGTNLIQNNTITGGQIGVFLNQVENAVVRDNVIHFQPYLSFVVTPGMERSGVYIFGGQTNRVEENSILGTAGTYTAGPKHYGTTNEEQYGVSAITSFANSISCNVTGNLYSAFRFAGGDFNTTLYGNDMVSGNSFVTGVYMQDWAGAGAVINQQGSIFTGQHHNTFNGNFNYPGSMQTVCDPLTNGGLSEFICEPGPLSPSPNGGPIPITVSATAIPTTKRCPVVVLRFTGAGNMGTQAEPIDYASLGWAYNIANDVLYNPALPYIDLLRYRSRSFLYAYLDERPMLRAADATLNGFYNAHVQGSIGVLYAADAAVRSIADTTGINPSDSLIIVNARNSLLQIAPGDIIAGYDAEIRRITWRKMLQDSVYYDSAERQRIEYIASLCPGEAGMSVYLARNIILGWNTTVVYTDANTCTGNGVLIRGKGVDLIGENRKILTPGDSHESYQIVPNPADNSCRLILDRSRSVNSVITLRDVNGKIRKRVQLPAQHVSLFLNLEDIPSGIYFYSDEAGTIKGKLVVHKK